MIAIESLRWTSRDEIGAELLPLLDDDGSSLHLPAARLVAFLAPRSLAPAYVRIALDRRRGAWNRIYALRALARSGEAIAVEALGALLAEDPPARAPAPSALTTPPLVELLALAARGGAQRSLLLAHLERKPLAFLRALLESSVALAEGRSARVERWLVERWLEGLADSAPDEEDAAVARAAADEYPEVRGVLVAHWQRAPHDERFWQDLYCWPELGRTLVADEATRAEAARALVSWPSALREVLGAEELRGSVIDAVHARSRALVRGEEVPSCRYQGALDWLECMDSDLAAELLADATLGPAVRAEIGVVLLRKHRVLALRELCRGGEPDHRPVAHALLRAVATNPGGQDLGALRACLDVPDAETQYRALDLLDALGEDGPAVRERLTRLATHEDPCLRVRALGALARRGDEASLRSLVEAAEGAAAVGVRAEAIRRLGALDAPARSCFRLFERALHADHARDGSGLHAPAAEQAAIALGAVFGGEALTALVRGHLVAPSEQAAGAIENAMAVAMEESSGRARSVAERREEILARDAGVTAGWVPFATGGAVAEG